MHLSLLCADETLFFSNSESTSKIEDKFRREETVIFYNHTTSVDGFLMIILDFSTNIYG